MKSKKLSLVMAFAMMISIFSCGTAISYGTIGMQTETITYRSVGIEVNGTEITPCDVSGNSTEPFIRNLDSSTYLPVRAVAGALGLDVDWDDSTSTVILQSGGTVKTGSGSPAKTDRIIQADLNYRDIRITLDGEEVALKNALGDPVEPFIKDGSTYIPVRAVATALGCEVGWNDATSMVILKKDTDIKTGDVITFGSYEQDNNAENGKEPIEWIVLEKQNSKALLVSKYLLDLSVQWAGNNGGEWYDEDEYYYNNAFTDAERTRILETVYVQNQFNIGEVEVKTHVFDLSQAEAEKYFTTKEERMASPTSYAKAQALALGADHADADYWAWELRDYQNYKNSNYVVEDGATFYGTGGYYLVSTPVGSRPAVWVSLD